MVGMEVPLRRTGKIDRVSIWYCGCLHSETDLDLPDRTRIASLAESSLSIGPIRRPDWMLFTLNARRAMVDCICRVCISRCSPGWMVWMIFIRIGLKLVMVLLRHRWIRTGRHRGFRIIPCGWDACDGRYNRVRRVLSYSTIS